MTIIGCKVSDCSATIRVTVDEVSSLVYAGFEWMYPRHYYGPFDFEDDVRCCDWCRERTDGVNFNSDRQLWQPMCSACSQRLAWAYYPDLGLSFGNGLGAWDVEYYCETCDYYHNRYHRRRYVGEAVRMSGVTIQTCAKAWIKVGEENE